VGGRENDFSCEQFMAPQPQFSVEINQTLELFAKMRLRTCLTVTYIAICTSCRKKHAERLSALGISDKGTRDQTAAATGKDFQSFVELAVVFFFVKHFVLNISITYCFPGPLMQGTEGPE